MTKYLNKNCLKLSIEVITLHKFITLKIIGEYNMSKNELHGEVFHPSQEVINYANIPDWNELQKEASEDNTGFWEKRAEELHWFKKWDKVLDDSKKPFFKWFAGGKTNISYNCLDVHTKTARRNKLALNLGRGKW